MAEFPLEPSFTKLLLMSSGVNIDMGDGAAPATGPSLNSNATSSALSCCSEETLSIVAMVSTDSVFFTPSQKQVFSLFSSYFALFVCCLVHAHAQRTITENRAT